MEAIWLYQFRMIVIGDSTVGKSCLIRRFTEGRFAQVSDPTVGVDFFSRLVEIEPGKRIKLQIWDTAGQERFRYGGRGGKRLEGGLVMMIKLGFESHIKRVRRSQLSHEKRWWDQSSTFFCKHILSRNERLSTGELTDLPSLWGFMFQWLLKALVAADARSITRAYYRNSVGGLLLFDITNRRSFQNVHEWLEEARSHVQPHQIVFVLVGHKCDLDGQRQVSRQEAEKLAGSYGMRYVETSARDAINVEKAFTELTRDIFELVKRGDITIQEGWEGVKSGFVPNVVHSSEEVMKSDRRCLC
ncbi:RB39B protein, partial [Polyodon spathula]|nr:RB39B protein [Polyodon spathula]